MSLPKPKIIEHEGRPLAAFELNDWEQIRPLYELISANSSSELSPEGRARLAALLAPIEAAAEEDFLGALRRALPSLPLAVQPVVGVAITLIEQRSEALRGDSPDLQGRDARGLRALPDDPDIEAELDAALDDMLSELDEAEAKAAEAAIGAARSDPPYALDDLRREWKLRYATRINALSPDPEWEEFADENLAELEKELLARESSGP